jgi:hypothetical protein
MSTPPEEVDDADAQSIRDEKDKERVKSPFLSSPTRGSSSNSLEKFSSSSSSSSSQLLSKSADKFSLVGLIAKSTEPGKVHRSDTTKQNT